jgi:hypothetical protein
MFDMRRFRSGTHFLASRYCLRSIVGAFGRFAASNRQL